MQPGFVKVTTRNGKEQSVYGSIGSVISFVASSLNSKSGSWLHRLSLRLDGWRRGVILDLHVPGIVSNRRNEIQELWIAFGAEISGWQCLRQKVVGGFATFWGVWCFWQWRPCVWSWWCVGGFWPWVDRIARRLGIPCFATSCVIRCWSILVWWKSGSAASWRRSIVSRPASRYV